MAAGAVVRPIENGRGHWGANPSHGHQRKLDDVITDRRTAKENP